MSLGHRFRQKWAEFKILKIFFLSGKGDAFLAVATPSPLTTPNPLKKPFNGWLCHRFYRGTPRSGALGGSRECNSLP